MVPLVPCCENAGVLLIITPRVKILVHIEVCEVGEHTVFDSATYSRATVLSEFDSTTPTNIHIAIATITSGLLCAQRVGRAWLRPPHKYGLKAQVIPDTSYGPNCLAVKAYQGHKLSGVMKKKGLGSLPSSLLIIGI